MCLSVPEQSPHLLKMFHLFLVTLVLTFFILIPPGQKPCGKTVSLWKCSLLHSSLRFAFTSISLMWTRDEAQNPCSPFCVSLFLSFCHLHWGKCSDGHRLFILFIELCSWARYFFYLAFWYSLTPCPECHYQISLEPSPSSFKLKH